MLHVLYHLLLAVITLPQYELTTLVPSIQKMSIQNFSDCFQALHDQAHGYIQELLDCYRPRRPLRSASTTSLTPRRHNTVSYGRRLVDTVASVIWNSLPKQRSRA